MGKLEADKEERQRLVEAAKALEAQPKRENLTRKPKGSSSKALTDVAASRTAPHGPSVTRVVTSPAVASPAVASPAVASPAGTPPVGTPPVLPTPPTRTPLNLALNITPKSALAFTAGIAGTALILAAAGAIAGFSLSAPFMMAIVAAATISVATVSAGYAFFSRYSDKASGPECLSFVAPR